MTLAKSARARPTLRYHDGGLLSNVHCWNFPSSALPSIAMTTCGLIQSTFVRVPVTDIRLVIRKPTTPNGVPTKVGYQPKAHRLRLSFEPNISTSRFTPVVESRPDPRRRRAGPEHSSQGVLQRSKGPA